MRIALFCHSSIGGSARVAVDLSRGLAHNGHDVHVFCHTSPWGLTCGDDGVTVHSLQSSTQNGPRLHVAWSNADREAFVELVVAVHRRRAFDVLHFHYAVPFAELALSARRRMGADGPALVGTLHGTDVGAAEAAGTGWILKQLDGLTTVSRSHAELAARVFDVPPPRVIANTIDLTQFAPRARAEEPAPTLRILHVSNFRPVKDPARLARAFVELRRRYPAELWLVGDGEEMPHVRSVLAAGEATDAVRAFGLRGDVESLYPHADVFALTSRAESFSLAALEASACGVPVVAPRVGGLPEVVLDRITGLLYDINDPDEPARTLSKLLEDHGARAAMGDAAARRALAFSRDRGVARYEALYQEILCERAAAEREPMQVIGQ